MNRRITKADVVKAMGRNLWLLILSALSFSVPACDLRCCLVTFAGDEVVSDRVPPRPGSFLTKAVNKITGAVFYNLYHVWVWPRLEFNEDLVSWALKKFGFDLTRVTSWTTNRVFEFQLGHTIRPGHRLNPSGSAQPLRAFTLCFLIYSKAR